MPFNEDWYDKTQLKNLVRLYRHVRPLRGLVIEIGCWEGRSTCKLANAAYPDLLHAVDTWQGNVAEGDDHPSVRIAKNRDVFAVFEHNVARLTKGNVETHRQDCFEFLANLREPVKFCHIDAAHDYKSVKRTIDSGVGTKSGAVRTTAEMNPSTNPATPMAKVLRRKTATAAIPAIRQKRRPG